MNIIIRNIDNLTFNNIWNNIARNIQNHTVDNYKAFKYNSLQQYKNNI
jgi:hypothetical protein